MKLTTPQQAIDLVVFLTEALNYIDINTPTKINAGGCGHFAKILYLKFKEMGFEPKIYGIFNPTDDSDKELKGIVEELKVGNLQNLSKAGISHVYVSLMGICLDASGVMTAVPIDGKDELTLELLDEVNEKGRWNPVFDKGCIPAIQKLVDETFGTFERGEWKQDMYNLPFDYKVTCSDYTIEQIKKQNPLDGLLSHIFQ